MRLVENTGVNEQKGSCRDKRQLLTSCLQNQLPDKPCSQSSAQQPPHVWVRLGSCQGFMSHSPRQAQAAHPCSGHTCTPAGTDRRQPGERVPRLTAGGAGFAQKVPVTQVCQHSHALFQASKELPLSPHGTFCCPQPRFNCMMPLHPLERLAQPGIIAKVPATLTPCTPQTAELQNRLQHRDLNQPWHCSSTANASTSTAGAPVLREGSVLCCCPWADRLEGDQMVVPQKPPSALLEKGPSWSS